MLNRPEFALKAYSPSPRDSSCFDRAGESKAIDQPSFGISTLTGVAPAAPKNASTTARTLAAFTRVVAFMASPGGATAPFAKLDDGPIIRVTFERMRLLTHSQYFCGRCALFST